MANKTFKLLTDKMGGRAAGSYVGREGEIFYDPTSTTLRVSDGVTPGGDLLPVTGSGNTVVAPNESYSINVSYDGVPTSPGTPASLSYVFSPAGFITCQGIAPANSSLTMAINGDKVRIRSLVPTTSIGAAGDEIGLVAFDSTYMYYCTSQYNGFSNIWKRVAWSANTW